MRFSLDAKSACQKRLQSPQECLRYGILTHLRHTHTHTHTRLINLTHPVKVPPPPPLLLRLHVSTSGLAFPGSSENSCTCYSTFAAMCVRLPFSSPLYLASTPFPSPSVVTHCYRHISKTGRLVLFFFLVNWSDSSCVQEHAERRWAVWQR